MNHAARDRLLAVLHAHQRAAPDQKLVLLSGDVHQGAAVTLQWPDGLRIYQFVSSPSPTPAGGGGSGSRGRWPLPCATCSTALSACG